MSYMKKISYRDISFFRPEIMGISIIGILFCHLSECLVVHGQQVSLFAKLLAKGTAFVDVFMVISGIGLYYSFSKNDNILHFYKKRVKRLLPTYFIIVVPYWIWKDIFVEGLGLESVIIDVSFCSFVFGNVKRFWFIFAILIFYLLFPFIYKFLFKFGCVKRNVIIALLLSIFGALLIKLIFPQIYSNVKIMIDRIPAFIVGTYIGKKCKDNEECTYKTVFMVFIMCIFTQIIAHWDMTKFIHGHIKYYTNTCLALCILFFVVFILKIIKSELLRNCLRCLGSITMEIYLFHSLYKNIFDYPFIIHEYLFLVVLLPVISAYIVNKCFVFFRTQIERLC